MRKQVAKLTSNIINPFLTGAVLILLISLSAAGSALEAIKRALILIALNILPIFLFVVWLVRHNRLDGIFASVHKQRVRIYGMAIILVGVSCIILFFLKAPLILLAFFVASFSVSVIFMCINLRWKVSVHTASIAAAVAILFILYGSRAMAFIVLVPLVGWGRVELEYHSLSQVAAGALLAPLILVVEFYFFGLI
ncbi:MAG: phosphatase PAP2 family protein [Dehalococcoidia bacterium]|nr:phosphatase PAP2 family protein [Dehalococcoidia bacterium]